MSEEWNIELGWDDEKEEILPEEKPTNPRTENGAITIGNGIYEFYKEYYE